ncbi:archaellin/type IV pilin N-terminal domain-containing protein [Methanoculleus receptaculi]|uniref:Flagellin n=1 Tax=Methanoculleus receptaculi TaxID=394967 RepID=A0AAX4FTM0_9EURY|nr:archaellin/type IV pilin N-terminal domain-containing protein [Methanoculleus receptaculi]WOX57278.1 archaellin/type IV pilin N-terminal domain-containing protein [Methanoculleus receptaculi]
MMKLFKNEDAFTGLEAAIVLIAFVVVAAVFSYVMLGAGFFATQQAQQVVHTGSEQASSSLEIIGNIYGHASTTAPTTLDSIEFTVGNTAGGTPIDISQMLVTFTSGTTSVVIPRSVDWYNLTPAKGEWAVIKTYNDINTPANHLLEPGEQFVLKIRFPAGADLKPYTEFSVNLQPAVGAVYPIKKTVPAYLDKVNIL